jgi:hypothetical protein
MKRDLQDAAKLWQDFREVPARRARRVTYDVPRAVAVMGYVELICYVTTHGRKVKLYKHEFAPGSRPILAAGKGRGRLYLIGSRFKVTALGITDINSRGHIVHAKNRYKVETL